MKLIFSLLNLFLTLTVVAQSTSQAEMIRVYQSNSREEKLMGFKLAMQARPETDQSFIRKLNIDPKFLFPEVTMENGKMAYEVGKRKISMMSLGSGEVEVDGKKFDFSPGKLEVTFYALEKHFNSKKTSLIDFLLPSAHANGPLLLVGAAAAATVALGIWAIGDYSGPTNQAKLKCENFKHEIGILHPDNQEWLIPRLKENMKRELWNAENISRCKDGKHADESTCSASKYLKECIQKLTPELHRAIAAIDDSGREIERGEVSPEQNETPSLKSSTAQ